MSRASHVSRFTLVSPRSFWRDRVAVRSLFRRHRRKRADREDGILHVAQPGDADLAAAGCVDWDALQGHRAILADFEQLNQPVLIQLVVCQHPTGRFPAFLALLAAVGIADLGDADVIYHETGPVHGIIGDVFEAEQDLLARIGREINLLLHPLGRLAAAADPGVAGAERVAHGILVGGLLAFQHLPLLAAVGGDRHVTIIPTIFQVVPGREVERGRLGVAEIERSRQRGVAIVAAVRPPGVRAVRFSIDQPNDVLAGEVDLHIAVALQPDVVRAVLADVGLLCHRKATMRRLDFRRIGLDILITIAARRIRIALVQVVGDHPIGIDVVKALRSLAAASALLKPSMLFACEATTALVRSSPKRSRKYCMNRYDAP